MVTIEFKKRRRNLTAMVLRPEHGQSIEMLFDLESLIRMIASCRDAANELTGQETGQLEVV